jgi:hypothetical protein
MWVRNDGWDMGATSNSESPSNSNRDSTREIELESEFDVGSDDRAESDAEESKSVADRLATVARVIWAAFLAFVVVLALIPAAAVLVGVTPFTPTETLPYVALVGFVVVGAIAIIGTAIWEA